MRRTLLLCAVVLAACAKSETPAADTTAAVAAPPPPAAPAPITLADVAGTWDVKAMPMDRDTVLTTSQTIATGTMEGWKLMLDGKTYNTKVVSVAGDSIVSETGPFPSVLRKGQRVTIHNVMRLRDGKMVGTIHAKYSNGDTTTMRVEGTRKGP
jgi:hypothetical protein